jgi:hypothetical protein
MQEDDEIDMVLVFNIFKFLLNIIVELLAFHR